MLKNMTTVVILLKNQLLAHAKHVAFIHMVFLATCYGDWPLSTGSDTQNVFSFLMKP